MTLPAVFDEPLAYALLVVAVYAALRYQATLTWTEYRPLHAAKVRLAPVADAVWGGVDTEKGGRDDPEFLGTTDRSVADTFRYLAARGFRPRLVNSVKRRDKILGIERTQYSAAHLVSIHPDGRQTEVYLFAMPDGETDVYAHVETAVTDPRGHIKATEQVDGDARDTLPIELFDPPQ